MGIIPKLRQKRTKETKMSSVLILGIIPIGHTNIFIVSRRYTYILVSTFIILT